MRRIAREVEGGQGIKFSELESEGGSGLLYFYVKKNFSLYFCGSYPFGCLWYCTWKFRYGETPLILGFNVPDNVLITVVLCYCYGGTSLFLPSCVVRPLLLF